MTARKKTIQQWTADGIKKAQAKRGRPITTGTTPAKDRKAKERAARAGAGGQRLNINLTPQGAADLATIQAKHPDLTKTEVIHHLMRGYVLS